MPVRKPQRRAAKQSPPATAGFSLVAVLQGLIFSFVFAVIAFLLWSLVFTLTSLPDSYMLYAAYATSFLAVLLGGRRAAARAGGAGLLNGGVVGVLYVALLMLTARFALSTPVAANLAGWLRPAIDVLAGIVGGIWGAGSRK